MDTKAVFKMKVKLCWTSRNTLSQGVEKNSPTLFSVLGLMTQPVIAAGGKVYLRERSLLNLSLLHPFEEIRDLRLSWEGYNNQFNRDLGLSSEGYNNQFNGLFDNVEGYESLRRLRNLEILDLSFNEFNNNILPFLNAATSLTTLSLQNNDIHGPVNVFCQMKKLRELNLRGNHFVGQLPFCLGSLGAKTPVKLLSDKERYSMDSRLLKLEGTIPPSLLAMAFLDISGNLFSEALPIPSQSIVPKNLFLHNNNFTGPIPETLLNGVQILDLSDNKLSGSIPQFVNTQNISILFLRGNDLTGSIPRELCDLSNIKLLDLSNNKLNGFIPSCLYNLSIGRGGVEKMRNYRAYILANLQWEFYKSTIVLENFVVDSFITYKEIEVKFATKERYDSYSGRSEFGDGILDYMYGMDLSNNELSGVIPEELGNLSRVRALNLSHNFLSSSIPSNFSNLKDIESLDLSYNTLHGSIPSQLGSLTLLQVFDVSHNNLSGIIPQGRQFNTFNEKSYLGNPLLCGPPTNRSCDATKSSEEANNGGEEEEDNEVVVHMLVFYYSTALTYSTVLIGMLLLMCFDCPWRRAWIRIIDAFITSAKTMFP